MKINKYFISYSIAFAICFNLLSYNSFGYFYQNNISSVSKDTVIDIITNDTTYEEAYSKDSIIKKSLFSFKKNWITTKSLIYDSAALISKRLLVGYIFSIKKVLFVSFRIPCFTDQG